MSYINPNITNGVNLGLNTIMIIPLIVITCFTYGRAPQSGDPARVAVTYFKIMLPIIIAWLVLFLIAGILGIVYENIYSLGGVMAHTREAQLRLSAISSLGSRLTDILFIMTLVEMGNGFLFCLAEMRTGLQKAMKYVAIGSCAILAILALASFGVMNAEYSSYLGYHGYNYELSESLYESRRKLSSAITILIFVWSLVLVVFAAVVFTKAKRNYVLKNSAMLFLIAAVLNLVCNMYLFINTVIFVLSDFYRFGSYTSYEAYTALMFVDPIITTWVLVASVSLVCAVLIRKNNGLWATVQPWMSSQVPPALAANPSYKATGEQWQQPSNNHVTGV